MGGALATPAIPAPDLASQLQAPAMPASRSKRRSSAQRRNPVPLPPKHTTTEKEDCPVIVIDDSDAESDITCDIDPSEVVPGMPVSLASLAVNHDPPVISTGSGSLQHTTSPESTAASGAPDTPVPVQPESVVVSSPPDTSAEKIVRRFNGHPLLEPYPLDLLPNRGLMADGSLNPIIELDRSARKRIETIMGHVTTITLPDGRILSDAREVIAVSDGKDFRAYMKESTAEHVKFRNSIKAKWSRTLAHIPAVYIKFDDVSREVAFIDRRGYMDIIHRGIGEPSAVEREKQLLVMMGIYGNDVHVLSEIQCEIQQEMARPNTENKYLIFIKAAEFKNARME
ncbi:uncharacterized protein BJ171DRAFT_523310 [Polychytrium aggregatum]|uniref:uncharacterized protein n=1 Tax=Polychytrium aggregatum TaxID=110093 RepID=UPI0022FE8D07|nr:uncharacterized protein BJ171DRAFT_544420 [Polychytrium aggregatum]XP_052962751.1 uncharacterized protein BJ171DRAFT_523310 [Polychytrium aggregatum]KAI9190554.1 hypothetical protein BJ171DRAFT_544420 [Polychytrium aggregatum]KAI9197094.1 hypothetical protein BJ171DRAFT_523310 [Polychytrium aggregatum]